MDKKGFILKNMTTFAIENRLMRHHSCQKMRAWAILAFY